MNKLELGEKIRSLRKAAGLRQEDLCAKAGVSIRVVKDIESGTGNPTLDNLESVFFVLNLDFFEHLLDQIKMPDPAPETPPASVISRDEIAERLESIETRLAQQPTDAEVERALAGKAKISQYGDDLWEVLTNMDANKAGAIRAALRLPNLLPEKGADSRDVLNAPSENQRNDEQVRLKKSPAG